MLKKNFFIYILLLFSPVYLSSQNITIESFLPLETDLTAITNGTIETDQNGEVAALIKIVTIYQGFTFDIGMLDIVRTVQKPGEIWLYVPKKAQKITINHPTLGMLRVNGERYYYFPCSIESGHTYEMVLTTKRVNTIVEEDIGGGYLSLRVTPSSAIVYVDDKAQTLSADGSMSVFLLYGKHTYRVEAPGYKPEEGFVNISSEKTQIIPIVLHSLMANVIMSVPMNDAEIWINNELKGLGQWKGDLIPGTYVIETRKEGHRSQYETITFVEEEKRVLTLQTPEPIFGRLRAECNPTDAEVWLGDKKLGFAPDIFSGIPIGRQVFRFTKVGYQSQIVETNVEEGKVAIIKGELVPVKEKNNNTGVSSFKKHDSSKAKNLELWIKGGLNVANIIGGSDETSPRYGGLLGSEMVYKMSKWFGINTGIFYSMQGDRERYMVAENKVNAIVKLDYINIPITTCLYLGERITFQIGIQSSLIITSKYKMQIDDVQTIITKGNLSDLGLYVKIYDFSIPMGFSYTLKNIVFEGRYNWGLTLITPNNDGSRNSVFQITIGYNIL